jgi:Family of unknown function (DUF6353)
MTKLTQLTGEIGKGLVKHSPIILSAMAGFGVISTSALTGIASYQAALQIKAKEDIHGTPADRRERITGRVRLVWKLYIPAGISTVGTIVCIVGSNRVQNQKTLAAHAALAFTEQAYAEYRAKVVEEYSVSKDRSIRDKVVADHVLNTAPSQEVLVTGPGNVLCCELFTGRYFTSDMETLRRVTNEINAKMLTHDYATLSDFYYHVGLKQTTESSAIGWESSKLMALIFSTALTDDGRPCITFEYNYTKLL